MTALPAQDRVGPGNEPVVASVDPAALTYDYLVDGNLSADDPVHRHFKTLQAAYAAAPAGTAAKPTVIGIKPNVYFLPGGAPRTPSMSIRKDYITFLGLTNNRRAVVLADNRGLMQGAEDNGYILDVNATGFTAKNLTILNYCNVDYDYPGDSSKNLRKRSDVITQAVALQAAGDKHVYDNVALLSRLDTMFLRTTRSYFHHVYIEGTDDWMGGGRISVWQDSTLVYPTGRGVMSAGNCVFLNCRFEAMRGMQFYKAEFRTAERADVLIDCVLPVSTPANRVAWIRGPAAPRPSQYSLTYRNRDASGAPAVIYDSSVGEPTFFYGRELSAEAARAYNPWNLLRAAPGSAPDDWDPAGVRQQYEDAGSLPYRIELQGGQPTVRTGRAGVNLTATPLAPAGTAAIAWSSSSSLVALRTTSPGAVEVTGNNTTDRAEWVPLTATATNGLVATTYVWVEPRFIEPPVLRGPAVIPAPANGRVTVAYALKAASHEDQSLITWLVSDTADGDARVAAVSRGKEPARTLTLTPGMVGKFLRADIRPKYAISEPGPVESAVSARPVGASDVTARVISPDFRTFVVEPNDKCVSGWWTVLGKWSVTEPDYASHAWGVKPTGPSSLLYQADTESGDMTFDLLMTPEKTEGMGFSIPGSPADVGERNLHADIYIKYDPRTRNGYALRFWRTTQSATQCMFQFYRIVDGAGSPLDGHQVLSGVFKPTTHLRLEVRGTALRASATNDVDDQRLELDGTIEPNRFGGAGVSWPRGSATTYTRLAISYPR
jgi:hypothetical protein